MSDRQSYCIEVYLPDLTTEQRDQLMLTICELLHRREFGIASGKSEVDVLVAARRAGVLEIETVLKSEQAYKAVAFPRRDGQHEILTSDEDRG